MSKIADQVFERLKAGESPRDVRKSFTSTARFVEGIQKFVTWAIPDTERLQKENVKEAGRQQELLDSKPALEQEFERLSKKVRDKSDTLKKAEQTEERLKKLQPQVQQLLDKGYTEDIMLRLSMSDAVSGGEMLRRVETIEKFEAEEKVLVKKMEELDKARGDLEGLKSKIEDLRKQEDTRVERLKTRELEEQLFEDAVKATREMMERYGLGDQDFRNLLYLITVAGSPGSHGQTMQRVRLILEQYRTLERLEAQAKGRNAALQKLNAEISSAEERLKTSTEAFTEQSKKIETLIEGVRAAVQKSAEDAAEKLKELKSQESGEMEKLSTKARTEIESAKKEAVKSLTDVCTKANDAAAQLEGVLGSIKKTNSDTLDQNSTQLKQALKDHLDESSNIIKELKKNIDGATEQQADTTKQNLESILGEAKKTLNEIRTTNTEIAEQHKEQLERWGRLQAEAGKYANDVKWANVMTAFMTDEEGLRLLGKDQVNRLLLRIIEWYRRRRWDSIKTTYSNLSSEVGFNFADPVGLDQILQWGVRVLAQAREVVSIRMS